MNFRQASLNDIPLIRHLADEIWRAHYPDIISVAQIDYMLELMYSEAKLQSEIAQDHIFYYLIEEADEALGFMSFHLKFDDKQLFVSKLYVRPSAHGKGYGREALIMMENEARKHGLGAMNLYVNKYNHKAIRAYRAFGMEVTEDIINDIGNGFVMDDYIMSKSL